MDWLTQLFEQHEREQREDEDAQVREMSGDPSVCWDDSSRDRWWMGLQQQADEECAA